MIKQHFWTKNIWLGWLLVGVAIILIGGWLKNHWSTNEEFSLSRLKQLPDHQIVTMTMENRKFQVEVVNTPASLTQGLSRRLELPADGMLFVLPETQIANFWMKEMNFGLDFIWLKANQVVGVANNVPPPIPETAEANLPHYQSPQPVDLVLEMSDQAIEQWGINDQTEITQIRWPD